MHTHVAFYTGRTSFAFYINPRRWHLHWYRDEGLTTWNLGPFEYCQDRQDRRALPVLGQDFIVLR